MNLIQKRRGCSPLTAVTRRSAVGFAIVSAVFLPWCLSFMIGETNTRQCCAFNCRSQTVCFVRLPLHKAFKAAFADTAGQEAVFGDKLFDQLDAARIDLAAWGLVF